MQTRTRRTRVTIQGEVYFLIAFGVFLLPVRWILGWLTAAAVHELCHYIAIRLCGCEVFCVSVGVHGAVMQTGTLSEGKECICALAGPASGLLLLLFARWLPVAAICGCVQSLYNLLPVFPLDGGRAIRCALRKLVPGPLGERIGRWQENTVLAVLILVGIYAAVILDLGAMPLLLVLFLLLKNKKLKIPCKRAMKRVQ